MGDEICGKIKQGKRDWGARGKSEHSVVAPTRLMLEEPFYLFLLIFKKSDFVCVIWVFFL